MTKDKPNLIVYFVTLAVLAGIWLPFTASAMTTAEHHMKHIHSAGDSISFLATSSEFFFFNGEPACDTCDGDMSDHKSNCSDSCCQSCVNCSGVATFRNVPEFSAQDISVKPQLPVTINLSVNLQLLERPPINI